MKNLTFVSWNLEQLGQEKIKDSGGAIFDLIADTVLVKDPHIFGCMGIPSALANHILAGIKRALNAKSSTKWVGEIIDPVKKEAYMVFTRVNPDFTPAFTGLCQFGLVSVGPASIPLST